MAPTWSSNRPRVLVTTTRMPFSVDLIRKLGESGVTVFGADTFDLSPGSHSRFIKDSFVVASPRLNTKGFINRIAALVREQKIDCILPTFEEVMYLAKARRRLPSSVVLMAPSFAMLRRLHDKIAFTRLLGELRLEHPPTAVVTSQAALRKAIATRSSYLCRPAYSRGGTTVLTNRGALAGQLDVQDCHPSKDIPWLVQDFIFGDELCTYSVARGGRVTAHVTYVHPQTIDHGGGVTFESVESLATLKAARAIARATRYTGHFGLDFRMQGDRVLAVECNPRATAGLSLLTADELVSALFGTPATPIICEPGRRSKIGFGLLLDMLQHWRHIPDDLRALFGGGSDLYARVDDLMPALVQVLAYSHVIDYHHQMPQEARHDLRDIVRAQFYDIAWEDEPALLEVVE